MKTKPWKSSTIAYSICQTFVFVMGTFTSLSHPFVQFMYLYYSVLTLLNIFMVQFEVEPVVNDYLRFYGNLSEVDVSKVNREKGTITATVKGGEVTFVDKTIMANNKRIHIYFSKVGNTAQTPSRFILVHEWHFFGYIDKYRVFEKV